MRRKKEETVVDGSWLCTCGERVQGDRAQHVRIYHAKPRPALDEHHDGEIPTDGGRSP